MKDKKSYLELLKKKDYTFLKEFEDKLKESKRVGTIKGYGRKNLKRFTEIYQEYGGSKNKSITQCNACAFKIITQLIKSIEDYEKRYYGRFEDETKKDETTEEETQKVQTKKEDNE